MRVYLLTRLFEAAHYSGNPVYVGYPVLYMRFGAKFWMSDLAYAGYDSVYFYNVLRLREFPFVIGLREVAFTKSSTRPQSPRPLDQRSGSTWALVIRKSWFRFDSARASEIVVEMNKFQQPMRFGRLFGALSV